MTDALLQLSTLETTICKLANQRGGRADEIQKYIWSLTWRLRALDHHCQILRNTDWGMLGMESAKEPLRTHSGEKKECQLALSSSDATILLVLMTVDNAAAAGVNVLDNLARLLNEGYGLDVSPGPGGTTVVIPTNMDRFVKKVADGGRDGTPLGKVLLDSPGATWTGTLRKLRGECQHGKITAVLIRPEQGFGMPTAEPVIAGEFCPDFVPDLRVSTFFASVHAKVQELLTAAMTAVIEHQDKALAST